MNQESWLEAEVDEGRREEEEDEQSREERDLRAPILFFLLVHFHFLILSVCSFGIN